MPPEAAGAAAALRNLWRRHSPAVQTIPARLGVCPAVVFKALSLLQREQATMTELEKVASCDPILATSLLSFANSALFQRSEQLKTVRSALSYIGIAAAKRVILAASARPLFASVELRELWQHSVDVASIAEQVAGSSGLAEPSEAFVAGLIHDLGRIAVELSKSDDFVVTHRRLAHAARSAVLADIVLTGRDHGEIGAEILSAWRLPDELVNAVRYHHRPELTSSPLASILYISENVADAEECICSPDRLEHAMETARLTSLDSVRSDLRRLGTALAMVG
jgi:putative nucleotidyltransferase with HDIG domain